MREGREGCSTGGVLSGCGDVAQFQMLSRGVSRHPAGVTGVQDQISVLATRMRAREQYRGMPQNMCTAHPSRLRDDEYSAHANT
jgi:hypothetical protein